MRETEDMIAVREVQGLMDNIGEPPALQPQACLRQGSFQMAGFAVVPPQVLLLPSLGSSVQFPRGCLLGTPPRSDSQWLLHGGRFLGRTELTAGCDATSQAMFSLLTICLA